MLQKNIVPPEKNTKDIAILKHKVIMERQRDIENEWAPESMSIQFLTRKITGTDSYYTCCYFVYNQMSTIFYIVYSNEFVTSSLAIKKHQEYNPIFNIDSYIADFFDIDFMDKNKAKFFKCPEYFLNFSNDSAREEDTNFKNLIKYLGVPRKKLKKDKNYFSLWDAFPDVSRLLYFRKRRNMKRIMKKLRAQLKENDYTIIKAWKGP